MARPRKPAPISPVEALQMLGEQLIISSRAPNILSYVPHAKQVEFHSDPSKNRLYIGGNRSGKTTGGVCEDVWACSGTHPYNQEFNDIARTIGVRGRAVAVDFNQGVEKILFPQFKQWMAPSFYRDGSWEGSYDKELRTLHFSNGSFIEFMSYDQDLDKFAGTSRHFIHFDEEPPEAIYTENLARIIDTNGYMWFTMTPVEGMTWIYDVIYEPGLRGEKGIGVVEVEMSDNPHISAEARQRFIDNLSEDERTARVEGKFVQAGGLIYKGFDPKPGGMHVLESEVIPDKSWLWAISLDHGFNNPTAVLWHAVSPDGRVLTFYEHYKPNMVIKEHAEFIHKQNQLLGKIPDVWIADPSIRNTDPITGTSIWQEYEKAGIVFQLANNDVVAGIGRVRSYMRPKADGVPMWRITPNCEQTIKEAQRYRYKTRASKKNENDNNKFELPHKKNDHAMDSLRYFIMSRPDLVQDALALLQQTTGEVDAYRHAKAHGLDVIAGMPDTETAGFGAWDVTASYSDYSHYGDGEYDEYLGGTG